MSDAEASQAAAEYFEKHNIKALFKTLMKELAIAKPQDPVMFLLNLLDQPLGQTRVLLIGPPEGLCDTSVVVNTILQSSNLVHVDMNVLVQEAVDGDSEDGKSIKDCLDNDEPVPMSMLLGLLARRVYQKDCIERGWLVTSLCDSQHTARALQAVSVFPSLVLRLNLDETTLTTRIATVIVEERERGLLGSVSAPRVRGYTPLGNSLRAFLKAASQEEPLVTSNKGPLKTNPTLTLSYATTAAANRKAVEIISGNNAAAHAFGSLCRNISLDDVALIKTLLASDQGV